MKIDSNYVCPTCGKPDKKPLFMIADEAGFIDGEHCAINRAAFGKVSRCQNNGLCEWCRFGMAVTELRPEGIGGRMIRVLKRGLRK